MSTVYREVWTGEVIRAFTHAETATFLDGIKDQSKYVTGNDEVQVIHMAYLGVKPDVLINNTTYPIAEQDLAASDVPIALDKFQTLQTPITDDELYALSIDKIANVKQSHAEAIAEKKQDKAIHALAPNINVAAMPVLATTGDDDGTGRKRLKLDDIVSLKAKWDQAKVPVKGRRLVLCSDHVNDLLLLDNKFKDQYNNYETGRIANMYGFEVYEYVNNPYYTVATLTKKSFGSVPAAGDYMASVAFSTARAVRANGLTKMYYSKAETDPATQRNMVNFRHYYIVLPTAQEARGAIVSGVV